MTDAGRGPIRAGPLLRIQDGSLEVCGGGRRPVEIRPPVRGPGDLGQSVVVVPRASASMAVILSSSAIPCWRASSKVPRDATASSTAARTRSTAVGDGWNVVRV